MHKILSELNIKKEQISTFESVRKNLAWIYFLLWKRLNF